MSGGSSADRRVSPDPSTKDGRRATRRRRDGLIFTAMIMAGLALLVSGVVGYTSLHNRSTILNVQDGRRLGVVTTCGTNQAIIAAGRRALQSGVLLPGDRLVAGRFVAGPLTKQLGPDFPSYATRVKAAMRAADAYQQQIVAAIIRTARANGVTDVPVVNGHLSCDKSLELGGLK